MVDGLLLNGLLLNGLDECFSSNIIKVIRLRCGGLLAFVSRIKDNIFCKGKEVKLTVYCS